MSNARYMVGDVFDRMAELPDGSVDLIVTSPPFLALRSYLPADHPDKAKEIGSEPTPAAFIDTMLALTAEWRRLLAPHGSIAVELGDTYAGSGGAGGDYEETGLRGGQNHFDGSASGARRAARKGYGGAADRLDAPISTKGTGWPLAKSKTLIPELYRIALAYGIHPLTGQPSPAGTWRVRNVVTWCRPNPPVGALGDKWRPATSDIVVACVSGKRYWDDIATRRPLAAKTLTVSNGLQPSAKNSESPTASHRMDRLNDEGRGAPLLDYWELPPEVKRLAAEAKAVLGGYFREFVMNTNAERTTTGWTDCGHDNYRPALILDPFAESGTTLMVAQGHGHDAVGIDLDERNADLARERIGGLFLTVEGAA